MTDGQATHTRVRCRHIWSKRGSDTFPTPVFWQCIICKITRSVKP